MAGELVHTSAGTTLTQTEFEAVGLHVCNSQATGDLIYASSSTQLSRLGIGATNKILTVIGGVPTWQSTLAGLTLTSPVINGTVTTTGLTIPAITLGGAVTGGGQAISNIASLQFGASAIAQVISLNATNYVAWDSGADAASRAWGFTTDLVVYGDWGLRTESSKDSGLDTSRIYIDASGNVTITALKVGANQVVGAQGAAVADATDAPSVILRLNDLLARCRAHGLIAT